MFTGIVEAQTRILSESRFDKSVRLNLQKPITFNDLKIGDSVAVNGICLTIEKFDEQSILFCLGAETLKLIGDSFESWSIREINLERSMKFGDRIHGHLVTGHVDFVAKVAQSYQDGECWQMQIAIPEKQKSFFWKKGSICLAGVSLTVNEITRENNYYLINVCLIPETIKKTNLVKYKANDFINVEVDYFAKAILSYREGLNL